MVLIASACCLEAGLIITPSTEISTGKLVAYRGHYHYIYFLPGCTLTISFSVYSWVRNVIAGSIAISRKIGGEKGLTEGRLSDMIVHAPDETKHPMHSNQEPWCSGPTCLPVTQKIAGSNPVGSGRFRDLPMTSLESWADLFLLPCSQGSGLCATHSRGP